MRERNSAGLNSQVSRNGGESRQTERSGHLGLQVLLLMPNMELFIRDLLDQVHSLRDWLEPPAIRLSVICLVLSFVLQPCLHEFSHAVAAKLYGYQVTSITIGLYWQNVLNLPASGIVTTGWNGVITLAPYFVNGAYVILIALQKRSWLYPSIVWMALENFLSFWYSGDWIGNPDIW